MAKASSTKTTKRVRSTVAAKVVHASPVQVRPPRDEEVAARAYELFLADGSQHGHHIDHWLRAERELGLGVR